ncbi:MAG: sulfatase-like hydrolase/transferase [Porphyromonas sp.]|nr:sulfatase-like hydrolase/transferase [Porphyromonas sp.]
MSRKGKLTAVTLGAASLTTLPATAQEATPRAEKSNTPNVIVILADDIGWGDLSPYGTSAIQTPAVEELAASGTRYTDAHCVAATSTPSRYSLLTGHYAWKRKDTGVASGDAPMIIHPEQYTVADLFKDAGYTTGVVGKWHLGLGDNPRGQDWNVKLTPNPSDLGFDYSYIMAATADRVPCVWIENGMVANYDPEHPIYVSYKKNFDGEPTGKDHPELLTNLRPSHGHDQTIVNGISRIGYMKGGGKALWKDEEIAGEIEEQAVNFIRENREQPFFLYLCTNDAHVPRFPREEYRKSPLGLRGDALLEFDGTVRIVLEELERQGLRDNTLIILTSDNGGVLDDGYEDRAVELQGSHQPNGHHRGGKYSLFEGGTRVPFIVSYPGVVPAGEVADHLVSHIDFLRSMAALLKVQLPPTAAPDSEDHLTTWLNTGGTGRDFVIEQGLGENIAIRYRHYKFIPPVAHPRKQAWQTGIETGQDTIPQLYDLRSDPGERRNLLTR